MSSQLNSPSALEQQQMSEQIYARDTTDQLDSWRCSARIPKELALSIYQNNLHGGVRQHLQTQFPVTHGYVGTQGYQFICAKYLKASPPEQPIFTLYAAHFPGFLLEYGEQHPQQTIWSVAARLAQIDFFHQNTFCEDQQIEVEEDNYQLWVKINSMMDSEMPAQLKGLYQQLDLHPERYQGQASKKITLVTFWDNGDLFFRLETGTK